MSTYKIVGKYTNGNIELFSEPQVCTGKHLRPGDIIEHEAEYVRMYIDPQRGLRFWYVTLEVRELMAARDIDDYEATLEDFQMQARGW